MKFLLLIGALAAVSSTAFASRVVCYYASWGVYKPDPFTVENIDATLCTHIVYTFVGVDEQGYIKLLDSWNDIGDEWHEGGFTKFQRLRKTNPKAKLMVAVGGWNEGPIRFQAMVRSPEKRKNFLASSLNFLRKYKFDGLEISWQFLDDVGGTPEDKAGYSALLKDMKPMYNNNGFLLTASVMGKYRIIKNTYDVPVLSANLDFMNVMSYDLHGYWDKKTGHVAPLHALKTEKGTERLSNVEAVINMYLEKGAAPEKLNLGVVGYGRTFTLLDQTNHGLNSQSIGAGKTEPLPYAMFCVQDRNGQWKKDRNNEQEIPYAYSGDQWVGYEDTQSLIAKAKFAKSKKLGGATFWSLDTDDFKGNCGSGKFPLLKALKEELGKP